MRCPQSWVGRTSISRDPQSPTPGWGRGAACAPALTVAGGPRTSHPTTDPWEQGPHTRWVIAKEILIYEQQNLLTPSLSGEGDVFSLACCRNRGCFELEAFLSPQPSG